MPLFLGCHVSRNASWSLAELLLVQRDSLSAIKITLAQMRDRVAALDVQLRFKVAPRAQTFSLPYMLRAMARCASPVSARHYTSAAAQADQQASAAGEMDRGSVCERKALSDPRILFNRQQAIPAAFQF